MVGPVSRSVDLGSQNSLTFNDRPDSKYQRGLGIVSTTGVCLQCLPDPYFFYTYSICNEKLVVLGGSLTCLNEAVILGLNHYYSEEVEWVGDLALSKDE